MHALGPRRAISPSQQRCAGASLPAAVSEILNMLASRRSGCVHVDLAQYRSCCTPPQNSGTSLLNENIIGVRGTFRRCASHAPAVMCSPASQPDAAQLPPPAPPPHATGGHPPDKRASRQRSSPPSRRARSPQLSANIRLPDWPYSQTRRSHTCTSLTYFSAATAVAPITDAISKF